MNVREMCAVSTMLSMLSTRYSAHTATRTVTITRATPAAQWERIGTSFSSDSPWFSVSASPSPCSARFSSSSKNLACVFSWKTR